ncbi:MAG: tRNA (guanosine(46)-N7)-methyltransferase TrmB [Treponema sp.]|jgi:tRNA (guanine-N7-)-methyltransferase|nr:tRNA (guanosine(46)-N7)-methyltransferase TrmB [Treponema sp.]
MSRAQERSYEEGTRFRIPYTGVPADFASLFGNPRPLTVEIGFGMGTATAEIAAANPEKNYLGIEVFKAGIGKLIWELERRSLSNVRIIERDAAEVLETMTAPGTIAAFHLFFPDPWPKKRHHKRRLVQRPFAETLASRLTAGGYIYMVTDWEPYAAEALEALSGAPGLFNPYGGFAPGFSWRPQTKFERKGLDKDHRVREIYVVKGAP